MAFWVDLGLVVAHVIIAVPQVRIVVVHHVTQKTVKVVEPSFRWRIW